MELLTNQQMALADRLTISADTSAATALAVDPGDRQGQRQGLTEFELLCNAGRQVASHVVDNYPTCSRVLVLCGPGNNGGDGYIAARVLADGGFSVRVVSVCSAKRGRLLQQAREFWGCSVEHIAEEAIADVDLTNTDLILDAMFGAGLTRDLQHEAMAWVRLLNSNSSLTVVAVDVPSGLNADTGMAAGVSIQATSTVTFFRLKPGHILFPGRQRCGEVELADIGIDSSVLETIEPTCHLNSPIVWRNCLQASALSHHKYNRGHTLVYSGPPHATGAARLSARGALRIGSGLVTLAAPADAVAIVAAHLTAIMIAPWHNTASAIELSGDPRINSVVIGPGFGVGDELCAIALAVLGNHTRTELRDNGSASPCVVLDADALTSFTDRRKELFSAIAGCPSDVVLTPHDGEYNRLFECAGSRLDRARYAASQSGAIVVLKGPDTVVAAPDGRATINNNAPPTLATAGSGDVLAGFIAGLLAQGIDGFTAASAAVWLHGQCANQFGSGLIAEDLAEQLPAVLAEFNRRQPIGGSLS